MNASQTVDEGSTHWRRRLSRVVNDNIRYFFLGPALVALLLVFVYPAVNLVWISLQKTRGITSELAPLYNYSRMFSDPAFWNAAVNTLTYSLGSLVFSIAAGLVIALALDKVVRERVRDVYTTLILISWAVPLSIVGITWRWLFNSQLGVINKILLDVGILESSYAFLGHQTSAMAVAVIADAWSRIPFAAIILLAGLQSIPQEQYDAAKVDGATTFQTFWNVTLPYLRPSFFVAGLMNWMFAFRAFAIPYATTGGGPGNATETLAIYVHRYGVSLFDFGFAAAVSMFLVAVTLVVAAVYVLYILDQMQEIEI